MPEYSKRNRQVADMILRELSLALRTQIKDPRLADLNVTEVIISPDLRHAKVYFTLIKDEELQTAQTALHHASGHFRHLIAQKLALRYTPTLTFFYDQTIVQAQRLSQLISKAEKKTNETKE